MNTLYPSTGHQYRISPGLQRRCSSTTGLCLIESFTQMESDLDLGTAESFCYTKDISDLPDSYLPLRWYERHYVTNPPVSPFTKAAITGPFSSIYQDAGDFNLFNGFQMTVGPSSYSVANLWGTPNRFANQLAWVGNFAAQRGCHIVMRSKCRIVPSDESWGVRAWVIPRVFWTCEFTFAYDSGPSLMVLSSTAEFKSFVTMRQGEWFDPLGGSFAPFASNNRMLILIIGETPEDWQTRTGITLTSYP